MLLCLRLFPISLFKIRVFTYFNVTWKVHQKRTITFLVCHSHAVYSHIIIRDWSVVMKVYRLIRKDRKGKLTKGVTFCDQLELMKLLVDRGADQELMG